MLSGRTRVLWTSFTSARANLTTGSASFASHYDVLGITPKATQSEIKTAYYKLTMKYHPDKNKTEAAKQKFRDVTEAYEVLGNYKSRRMYDRGMRPGDKTPVTAHRNHEPDDAQTQFYKSRMRRHQPPTATGRTPIYDFDEWSRAHYGAAFNRRNEAKAKYNRKIHVEIENQHDIQREFIIFTFCFITIIFVILGYTENDKRQIDQNKILTKAQKKPEDSEITNVEPQPLGSSGPSAAVIVEAKQV